MRSTRKDGTRSIQLGIDKNPDVTKADFIPAKAAKNMKKAAKGMKYKGGGKYKVCRKPKKYGTGGKHHGGSGPTSLTSLTQTRKNEADMKKKLSELEAQIKKNKGTAAATPFVKEYRRLTGTK